MKIRTRLTISFTLLVITLVVVRSTITFYSIRNYNRAEFTKHLRERATTTAELLLSVRVIDSAHLKAIDRAHYDVMSSQNITVYDSANNELYTNNDTVFYNTSPTLFNAIRLQKTITYEEGEHQIIAFCFPDSNCKYIVIAGAVNYEGAALLSQLNVTHFYTLIVSILTTLLMGWFFVGRLLHPISSIVNKVKTLSPVERSERLPQLTEKDEIAGLVDTFNQLLNRLEDSFSLQQNFVANVSHEINNPLTKIKSQLEVSLLKQETSEDYRLVMESVLEDVNELTKLIQDLLNFSRMPTETFIAPSPTRIDELLFDIREMVISYNNTYKVNISFKEAPTGSEQLICYCNKPLLQTALKNIIENACKFAHNNTAEVQISGTPSVISVTISDNGPGINSREMPFIFEPFYRSSSTKEVKGFGIGLALAYRILKAHSFPLEVTSEAGKGTTFTVNFLTKF